MVDRSVRFSRLIKIYLLNACLDQVKFVILVHYFPFFFKSNQFHARYVCIYLQITFFTLTFRVTTFLHILVLVYGFTGILSYSFILCISTFIKS
jgi:hypothetical protein